MYFILDNITPVLFFTIRSIPDVYAEKLVSEGIVTEQDVKNISEEYTQHLQTQYAAINSYKPEVSTFKIFLLVVLILSLSMRVS